MHVLLLHISTSKDKVKMEYTQPHIFVFFFSLCDGKAKFKQSMISDICDHIFHFPLFES